MNTVTIDAIAAEALSTTEDVVRILDELKARPREDWRGRLVVEDTIARRVVERAREEERERMLRHETWQAALRTHAAEAERVYDEALNAERQVQARRQFEDMEARVAGDSGFTSLTFQGPLPLDPKYVQRAYEAANKARAKWLQKNPAPTPENVRI